ncbi:uncharacterized protein An11g05050 [Aspergillus niger]|uniref:Contig An11c0200, genomic contig n=2 Tax=Aspergillus niger TaxID=5061 RepID=A2QWG3_ASPNC|nr:uncharacterized protein An11g05050 [Aspergillus niger]CAK48404.1 unnamed protein product [Aspergillus niger]
MSPLSIWNRVQGLRICRLWSLVALSHLERIRSLAHGISTPTKTLFYATGIAFQLQFGDPGKKAAGAS